MDIVQNIKDLIVDATQSLGLEVSEINLEHPTELSHGDFATNVAMQLAKTAGKNPRALAEEIVAEIYKQLPGHVSKVEVAGPGFINFHLSPQYFASVLEGISASPEDFGKKRKPKGSENSCRAF